MRDASIESSLELAGRGDFIFCRDPVSPPAGLEACVAVIGNFDGLHRGHGAVIARGRELARRMGRPCAVLTFEPHPADFFAGRSVVFRLTPEPAKALVLARLGLDGMVALTFDAMLAGLSAEDFVKDVLVRKIGASAAVVGFDFHFGRGRRGSPELLKNLGADVGLAVDIVAKVTADPEGSLEAVHSTAVRAALECGDVAEARRLLGRHWFVLGQVVPGRRIGREIGFPTANLVLDPSCKLRFGVYAVRAADGRRQYDGVASFGTRPTFDDGPPLLEVHLFDFDGDLYGKLMEVHFLGWIRPEAKFDDVETLRERMVRDADAARQILGVDRQPLW